MPEDYKSLLHDKVVSIFDIRAAREAAKVQPLVPPENTNLTLHQRAVHANLPFLAERLAQPLIYGAMQVVVVKVSGVLMLDVDCEAYSACYFLDADMRLDFTLDPIVYQWNSNDECAFPISPPPIMEPHT